MAKSFMGSLVIAPVELPPQALPASMRRVAFAAKDLLDNPTPKTAARLAEARLGTVVHPFGGAAFLVSRVANVGGKITLSGITGDRRLVAHELDPEVGLMPKWAVRLASAIRTAAFDINGVIHEALQQHALPIDQHIDWSRVLPNIFRKAKVPEDKMEDTIQEAVFRALYLRDNLSKFDPSLHPNEPLDRAATNWIIQLMKWQATGDYEAGALARDPRQLPMLDAHLKTRDGEDGTRAIDLVTNAQGDGFSRPDEEITPESFAIRQSDVRSLTEFRSLFSAYVTKYKPAKTAQMIMLLFDLIVTSSDGAEISNRWVEATGSSYSNLRKVLSLLKDEMIHFSDTKKAPGNKLTKIIQEIKNRAVNIPSVTPEMMGVEDNGPGPKAAPAAAETPEEDEIAPGVKTSSLQVLAADAFMSKLASTVLALKKQAAQVIDQSMLYIRMSAGKDPRFMELTFFSPSLRMEQGGGRYRIEVGDWSTDQGLNERKVKDGLNTFVVPQLRGDVLEDDHVVLEKVIRKLKDIVWENAVAFFEVPMEKKPSWSNTVKLDIQTLLDHKVTLVDKNKVVSIAKWTRPAKPWAGPKALRARSLGGEQNLTPAEQTDFAPDPDHQSSVTAAMDSFPDESKLPKGRMVAEIPSGSWSGGMPMFLYKAAEPRNNRPYFLVQGFGPYTQMGTWLTMEQAMPYLDMDPAAKHAADANDHRPDDPEPAANAKAVGAKGFDPEFHDADAEPAITFMAEHLKANGVPDTAENMQEAITGFTEARDAHHKESSMTNAKFASLKRIAAENPGGIIEAVKAIADKAQDMADNLKVMVENLQGGDEATHVEGDAAPAEPVPGQEAVTAGVQHIAAETPDLMEEALVEAYKDTDELMSLFENLADNLDIPLAIAPDEESGETEVEEEETPQPEGEPVAAGE